MTESTIVLLASLAVIALMAVLIYVTYRSGAIDPSSELVLTRM